MQGALKTQTTDLENGELENMDLKKDLEKTELKNPNLKKQTALQMKFH